VKDRVDGCGYDPGLMMYYHMTGNTEDCHRLLILRYNPHQLRNLQETSSRSATLLDSVFSVLPTLFLPYTLMEQTKVRQRPPELLVTGSYEYSTGYGLRIGLDYYVPDVKVTGRPVMLFVRGGAWINGNRKDYSRPLFQAFISNGCIVVLLGGKV
jgi:acetyl esterase/lipase